MQTSASCKSILVAILILQLTSNVSCGDEMTMPTHPKLLRKEE